VGSYLINQGTLTSTANYIVEFVSAKFDIVPAVVISVTNPDLIKTPWSVVPSLPTQLAVVTADGQVLQLGVTWDLSTLNVFKRGKYFVTGTLILPAGVTNPQGFKPTLEIEVLPKPAPLDIILSNNVFFPDPRNFFQVIGSFTVIDPIDRIHVISLVNGALDNQYFEVKEGILFWSSAEKVAGRIEFMILVSVLDRDGNRIEKSFLIRRERVDVAGLEVFNTFTPDGDGINDTWGVPDLRYFTGVRVQVFDRSGERLFYTVDPDDRWDGTYKGNSMPVGTYYWIIQVIETGEIRRRGILNILKK
jgi:gliding motility-associated-like protein